MRIFLGALFLLLLQPVLADVSSYQETADEIVESARSSEKGWDRLATLCTLYPHRLSGTSALEDAIDWIAKEMESDGFDRVTTEEVTVPHWERGVERLTVLKEKPEDLAVLRAPELGAHGELVHVEGEAAQVEGVRDRRLHLLRDAEVVPHALP